MNLQSNCTNPIRHFVGHFVYLLVWHTRAMSRFAHRASSRKVTWHLKQSVIRVSTIMFESNEPAYICVGTTALLHSQKFSNLCPVTFQHSRHASIALGGCCVAIDIHKLVVMFFLLFITTSNTRWYNMRIHRTVASVSPGRYPWGMRW